MYKFRIGLYFGGLGDVVHVENVHDAQMKMVLFVQNVKLCMFYLQSHSYECRIENGLYVLQWCTMRHPS